MSTPGSPATHDCSHASVAHQWGEFGDIPIVGTRFSTSSPGEFTVYRPSDSTLYKAVPYAGWTSRPLGLTAAERGQAPYVASFDTHGGSDIAFFDAQTAKFSLWLSGSSWASRIDRPFCYGSPSTCPFVAHGTGNAASRTGGVPVWGLVQMKSSGSLVYPVGALGLWDPSNGTWNVMWDPVAGNAMETHQWGDSGDTLIADAIGRKPSEGLALAGARSELVAYRSALTGGPGYFYTCAFSPGAWTCPVPAGNPRSIPMPGVERRTQVFAASDMVGDKKPELCAFDLELQTVTCATPDSNYSRPLP